MAETKTTHTPGPWQVGTLANREDGNGDDERIIEQYPGGPVIGTAWPMGEDFDGENDHAEREANARLIAAAPELLAVARAVLDAWHANGRNFERPEPAHVTQARAVLARLEAL